MISFPLRISLTANICANPSRTLKIKIFKAISGHGWNPILPLIGFREPRIEPPSYAKLTLRWEVGGDELEPQVWLVSSLWSRS
jgi:hypothetical protein